MLSVTKSDFGKVLEPLQVSVLEAIGRSPSGSGGHISASGNGAFGGSLAVTGALTCATVNGFTPGTVTETQLSFTDITTGNATALKHGLLPKLSGNASDVLKGDGTFGAGGAGGTPQMLENWVEVKSTGTLGVNYEGLSGFYFPFTDGFTEVDRVGVLQLEREFNRFDFYVVDDDDTRGLGNTNLTRAGIRCGAVTLLSGDLTISAGKVIGKNAIDIASVDSIKYGELANFMFDDHDEQEVVGLSFKAGYRTADTTHLLDVWYAPNLNYFTDGYWIQRVSSPAYQIVWGSNLTGQDAYMTLNSNGTLTLDQYTSAGTLSVNGSGLVSSSSDARLKTNIRPITEASLPKIMKLRPVSFEWTEDVEKKRSQVHEGFIAQDVEKVIPNAVDGKKHPYRPKMDPATGKPVVDPETGEIVPDLTRIRPRGLDLTSIVAHLVKAMKEQQGQIEALRKTVTELSAVVHATPA